MYKFSRDIYFANGLWAKFCDFIFAKHYLPKDFATHVDYHCSNHTAAGEVLVHLPSGPSHYCHFRETLLMLSQVVDTSAIYLRGYVVAAHVHDHISRVQTSLVGFGRRRSAVQMGSYSNRENPHVVAVVRVDLTVGHISHTISGNFVFLFCEPALSCKLHKIYILQKLVRLRHEKQ